MPLLCLQWKTPDDWQRNSPKHVEFYSKNKFEKLVHLVGFITRIRSFPFNPGRCFLWPLLNLDWYSPSTIPQFRNQIIVNVLIPVHVLLRPLDLMSAMRGCMREVVFTQLTSVSPVFYETCKFISSLYSRMTRSSSSPPSINTVCYNSSRTLYILILLIHLLLCFPRRLFHWLQ